MNRINHAIEQTKLSGRLCEAVRGEGRVSSGDEIERPPGEIRENRAAPSRDNHRSGKRGEVKAEISAIIIEAASKQAPALKAGNEIARA